MARTPRALAVVAGCIFVVGIPAAIPLGAQDASPSFDVAAIKAHVANSGVHETSCSNGRLSSKAYPLWDIIAWAYDLQPDAVRELIQQLPGTKGKDYYDIEAESETRVTQDQCRLMTQHLLRDRFKLAVHWESKDAEIAEMIVAPGGPKMRQATEADEGTGVSIVTNGRPMHPIPPPVPDPKGWTMERLAEFLTGRRVFKPIVDKTGLEGRYKIDLRYSDLQFGPGDQDVSAPDLETALAKQLGLRLVKHKGSVQILVLDHWEAPTPN